MARFVLHIRWQRRYDASALAAQIAGQLGIAASIAAPLPRSAPAVSNGLWRPISVSPDPAPPYGGASVPASAPIVASGVAAAAIAPSRRACGQCQAELREGAKFCAECGSCTPTSTFPQPI